jgi:hypothetical protein
MASQQPWQGQPAHSQPPIWGSHLPAQQQPMLTKHKVWLAVAAALAALEIFALGCVVGARVHGGKSIEACAKEAREAKLPRSVAAGAIQACVEG